LENASIPDLNTCCSEHPSMAVDQINTALASQLYERESLRRSRVGPTCFRQHPPGPSSHWNVHM